MIQLFQLELPLKALLEAPTVAQMAGVIEGNHDRHATDADLARMLSEVEAMTEADAQRHFDEIDSTITQK